MVKCKRVSKKDSESQASVFFLPHARREVSERCVLLLRDTRLLEWIRISVQFLLTSNGKAHPRIIPVYGRMTSIRLMKASKSPHLFPNTFYTESLDTWAAAIRRVPSETEQCLLEQVVHYKALSDMEHEFLIVYASHPSGSKIVLGIDRNAEALSPIFEPVNSEAEPSSYLASSARYLSTLMQFSSSPSSSSSTSDDKQAGTSPHLAYDGVQVSHDGTPTPILTQHGPSVPLSTISFVPSSSPHPPTSLTGEGTSTQERKREHEHRSRPSLLHLSILLLTIHTHFPSYALLQYQCYFFARATCLVLIDHFGGTEMEHAEGRRAATWRGVHISLYSAGRTALQNMLLLPLVDFPALIVPAGLFAAYSAVKLYDGNVVESEVDRRRIRYLPPFPFKVCRVELTFALRSDDKIREHAIPHKYRTAWQSFVLEGVKVVK